MAEDNKLWMMAMLSVVAIVGIIALFLAAGKNDMMDGAMVIDADGNLVGYAADGAENMGGQAYKIVYGRDPATYLPAK